MSFGNLSDVVEHVKERDSENGLVKHFEEFIAAYEFCFFFAKEANYCLLGHHFIVGEALLHEKS